jgi:hypothetical protein
MTHDDLWPADAEMKAIEDRMDARIAGLEAAIERWRQARMALLAETVTASTALPLWNALAEAEDALMKIGGAA